MEGQHVQFKKKVQSCCNWSHSSFGGGSPFNILMYKTVYKTKPQNSEQFVSKRHSYQVILSFPVGSFSFDSHLTSKCSPGIT